MNTIFALPSSDSGFFNLATTSDGLFLDTSLKGRIIIGKFSETISLIDLKFDIIIDKIILAKAFQARPGDSKSI